MSVLQEWLRYSSSSQPPLAEGRAEQSLLSLQPSHQIQDGSFESHTSAATQSQQLEDCSSSSPYITGLYHSVVLSYGSISNADALSKPAWRELLCTASG